MDAQENSGCSAFVLFFLALFGWMGVVVTPVTDQVLPNDGDSPPPVIMITLALWAENVTAEQMNAVTATLNQRLTLLYQSGLLDHFVLDWHSNTQGATISIRVSQTYEIDPELMQLLTRAGVFALLDVSAAPDPNALIDTTITDYPLVLTHEDVIGATLVRPDQGGFSVQIDLTADGAARMAAFTEANIGATLALTLDGMVLSTPIVQSRIDTPILFTGIFTESEASLLTALIGSPPLPFDLFIASYDADVTP